MLQTMTADRGRAEAQTKTAEYVQQDAGQRANPENQTEALADVFAVRSGEYDLRNRMERKGVTTEKIGSDNSHSSIKGSREGRRADSGGGSSHSGAAN